MDTMNKKFEFRNILPEEVFDMFTPIEEGFIKTVILL